MSLNSFQLNLQDSATAEAKRVESPTVEPIHVVIALAAKYQPEAHEALRAIAMGQGGGRTSTAIAISPEAAAVIEAATHEDAAIAQLGLWLPKFEIEPVHLATKTEQITAVASTSPSDAGEENPPTVEEVMAELNALIGLDEVKTQVQRFMAMHQANQTRRAAGQSIVPLSMHLVFTGDPGTGKTTVARIVGRLYRAAGFLPKGHLVETDRSGLVAGYVGQTALKVQDLLKEANGGVLFIDEAYSLATDSQSSVDFGQEAIAALVKGMEDQRETMAVIASGYKAQMDTFIESNPGLRSRFQTFIDFPNYNPDEMVKIFELLGKQHNIEVNAVVPALKSHFENVETGGTMGNGRYVRALFEGMYANLALRAAADGQVEIHELGAFLEVDLPQLKGATAERRRIGFI